KTFCEPSFIVCASATEDVQAIKESALSNTAVIAFCDGTASLNQIDIPISCNTHSRLSIGVMFYLLVRQILRLKGTISNNEDIPNLTVDNFIQQKKINPSSQNKAGSNAQNERGNKRERSEKSQYKKRRNNNQSNSKEGTKAQTTSGLDENNEANYENKNNQNNQEEDDWN
ncbi:MAG: structural constituent of ribosome, partial [Paramarteilia canceri]